LPEKKKQIPKNSHQISPNKEKQKETFSPILTKFHQIKKNNRKKSRKFSPILTKFHQIKKSFQLTQDSKGALFARTGMKSFPPFWWCRSNLCLPLQALSPR